VVQDDNPPVVQAGKPPAGKSPAGKLPVIRTKKGAVTQGQELVSQRVSIEIWSIFVILALDTIFFWCGSHNQQP
jgi:hypothetical protein